MMEKPKEIPKEKETQKCYIFLDIPVIEYRLEYYYQK